MNVGRSCNFGVLCLMAVGIPMSLPATAAPIPSPEKNEVGEIGASVPIRSWEAPRFYQPTSVPATGKTASPESPNAVSSTPLVFVAVAPCRILDTRGLNPPNPAYGAPALSHNVTREFQVTGSCGIPAGAAAVSANATIVTPVAAGYLALWDGGVGSPWPGNSTMNWTAVGVVLANAAIVPLSATGTINALAYVPPAGSTTHFILDVNGYYTTDPMRGPFVKYSVGASQTLPANSFVPVNFGKALLTSSDAAGLVTTGASWHFTAPKDGIYEVAAQISVYNNSLPGGALFLDARVNGYDNYLGVSVIPANTYSFMSTGGVVLVNALGGQTIDVAAYSSNGGGAILAQDSASWVSIRFVRPYP